MTAHENPFNHEHGDNTVFFLSPKGTWVGPDPSFAGILSGEMGQSLEIKQIRSKSNATWNPVSSRYPLYFAKTGSQGSS